MTFRYKSAICHVRVHMKNRVHAHDAEFVNIFLYLNFVSLIC
jgi:hypothetical protein